VRFATYAGTCVKSRLGARAEPHPQSISLKLFHTRGDTRAPIHDLHFLARAWQLANAKAQELGWVA